MAELTNALVQSLTGRLINGRGVATLAHDPTASRPYRIHLDDGERLDADIVILAAPAYTAAELVRSFCHASLPACARFAMLARARYRWPTGAPMSAH
ncbi:MAG: hypothetical protein U0074_04420 [Kouleothrix sp.]